MKPQPVERTGEKSPAPADSAAHPVAQEMYTKAFLLAPDAITVSDVETGRFIEVNDATSQIFGFAREELIGKHASELDIWLKAEDRVAFFEQIAQQGRIAQFEIVQRRKTGELINTSITAETILVGNTRYLITVIRDITDRRRVEQALNENEEKYKTLFENANDAIFLMDRTVFLDCNRRTLAIFHCTREQIVGHSPVEFSPEHQPDLQLSSEKAREKIDAALSGVPQFFEWVHTHHDRTPFYAEVSLNRARLGNTWYLQAVVRDITTRKQTELALTESEERYSALFSDNHSVSLIIDPDTGRIVDANDAAVRYYGYPHDRLLAMGIYDLNRLPREKVVQNLVRAKDENAKHFQSAHYRSDGEKRYVEIYSGPIRVRGKPLFYSIIHDITDRNLAEEKLKESEERYRTLIDQLPDYIIVHRDGILLFVNPKGAANLKYEAESLIGRSVFSLIAPESHRVTQDAVNRRMRGEDVPPYEITIAANDGTCRKVLVHGGLVHFDGGPASINVLTDITSLKDAEAAIRLANEDLEKRVLERTDALRTANEHLTAEIAARALAEQEITRSLEEKVLLLREIHHRVKNNLQIITSLLKLQSRFIDDPHVLEAIKDTQSRVRAMSLVHERIYRSPDIAEINLKDYLTYLIKQVFQFYNTDQQKIGLSVTMPEIMADIDTVTPLGLIINELVSNSLKYAFPDGRSGMVSLDCTPLEAGRLRFVYHDTGIGLPPGFDWRAAESLGLRLVNSLVDQLDGKIESGKGEGTTFILELRKAGSARAGEEVLTDSGGPVE